MRKTKKENTFVSLSKTLQTIELSLLSEKPLSIKINVLYLKFIILFKTRDLKGPAYCENNGPYNALTL